MNQRIFYILVLFCFNFVAYGQFFDEFNDGNLTESPLWEGEIQNYIVNSEEWLQLNAPEAGSTTIYTETSIPDSTIWEISFLMKFAPSGSNNLVIFLQSDQNNLDSNSGYGIEIGETGDQDAIHFFRSDGGNKTTLASATMGALGSDPAQCRLKVTRTGLGEWKLETDYDLNNVLSEEFTIIDNTYGGGDNQFFIINNTYTSTRIDLYYFDDIKLDTLKPDTEGPSLNNVVVENANQLRLYFSEEIDPSSVLPTANYTIQNFSGNVSNASHDSGNPSQLVLELSQDLDQNTQFLLTVNNISDLFNNKIIENNTWSFFLTNKPDMGDIVVNEILFDPISESVDFVEILNRSDKIIDLKDLVISNESKSNNFQSINKNILSYPGDILAISSDTSSIKNVYEPIISARFHQQSIPTFNNDEGNVSLIYFESGNRVLIDSFDYTDDLHYDLLGDIEGVSLERISSNAPSLELANWHSAASAVQFATPGYENSNGVTISAQDDFMTLESRVFSPNDDGDNDLLILKFDLEKSGFSANVKIFDQNGHFVKDLARNELLGTESVVKWDGTLDEGMKAKIGVYIIWVQLFHPDGELLEKKDVAILAEFLN